MPMMLFLFILKLESRGPERWRELSQVIQERRTCGRTKRGDNVLIPTQHWAAEHK